MRRLLYFAALSMLALLILAPAAQAESVTGSEGGGPSGPYGKYTCADFADLSQAREAYHQGGAAERSILDPNGDGIACGDSDDLSEGGTWSGGGPSGPYGLYTCADFADQWQAQEAYLQGALAVIRQPTVTS